MSSTNALKVLRSIFLALIVINLYSVPAAAQTVEELQAEVATLKAALAAQKTAETANAQSTGDVGVIESFPLRAKRFASDEAKAILVARDALERQLGHPIEAFYGVAHLQRGYRVLIQTYRGRDSKGTPRFAGSWDIVVFIDWSVLHIHELKPGVKLTDPTASITTPP